MAFLFFLARFLLAKIFFMRFVFIVGLSYHKAWKSPAGLNDTRLEENYDYFI